MVSNGGPSTIPSTDTFGKINTPQYYNEEKNNDRINPDILTAFKQNPYTQSQNPYYILDKFYGNLSIEEYRKL